MEIINCTPHDIKVENGQFCVASGIVARVEETTQEGRTDLPFVCKTKQYNNIVGLGDPKPGRVYIVSLVVFGATDREDVICPDTGPESAVRDEKGRIIAVRRFMSKF